MTRDEFYHKVVTLVAEDAGVSVATFESTTVASIERGLSEGCFLDLTDVLPQLDGVEIDAVLSRMAAARVRFFAAISVNYSDEVLPDGFNKNKTVEPRQWWLAMLRTHFEKLTVLRAYQESDVSVANFEVSSNAMTRIKRVQSSLAGSEVRRLANRAMVAARIASGMTVSQKGLFRDLEGKTVALVGNARSLGSSSHGSLIDSHDIVVRFNRVPIVSRRSHGFRTDWIATGVPLDQDRLDNLGASRVLWMSPYRRKMTADTIFLKELYVHPVKEIQALAAHASVARPTTGLTAIELFHRSPCRAVDLYGFDFYASQSSSSHQTVETAPHAFDREEAHVRHILSKDKRFSLVR